MKWVAKFRGGTVAEADDDDIVVYGPGAETVDADLAWYVTNGWPTLSGWDIDTTPGFDPYWMYLRLLAAGAVEVEGPCPACDDERDEVYPDDAIVG